MSWPISNNEKLVPIDLTVTVLTNQDQVTLIQLKNLKEKIEGKYFFCWK